MSKKLIIIAAALGIVGFGASFLVSFILGKKAVRPQEPQQPARQMASETQINTSDAAQLEERERDISLTAKFTEQQLKGLIHDVREKVRAYDKKMKQLAEDEKRLNLAHKSLEQDIESLNKLRTEVASLTAELKQQRQFLIDTRIEIQQSEKANFERIAATYDTMKPAGAAQIFTNMTRLNTSESKGLDDVVAILYYMNDRTKAKVLAELVNTEPKLAAVLSQELKKIKEVAQ